MGIVQWKRFWYSNIPLPLCFMTTITFHGRRWPLEVRTEPSPFDTRVRFHGCPQTQTLVVPLLPHVLILGKELFHQHDCEAHRPDFPPSSYVTVIWLLFCAVCSSCCPWTNLESTLPDCHPSIRCFRRTELSNFANLASDTDRVILNFGTWGKPNESELGKVEV